MPGFDPDRTCPIADCCGCSAEFLAIATCARLSRTDPTVGGDDAGGTALLGLYSGPEYFWPRRGGHCSGTQFTFWAATAALAQVACAFLLAANIKEHNVKSVRDDCESIAPCQHVITRKVEIESRMRSRKIERADFAAWTNWKNGRAACG